MQNVERAAPSSSMMAGNFARPPIRSITVGPGGRRSARHRTLDLEDWRAGDTSVIGTAHGDTWVCGRRRVRPGSAGAMSHSGHPDGNCREEAG
jgi:hypothetical protein